MENEDPLVPDISYGPSSTATVHITVLDVNEGPVFYPDPMMVTRQEDISVGSVLLTVNATDPDSLQHQIIRWVSGSRPDVGTGGDGFSFPAAGAACQVHTSTELKVFSDLGEQAVRSTMKAQRLTAQRYSAGYPGTLPPHLIPSSRPTWEEGISRAVFPNDRGVCQLRAQSLKGEREEPAHMARASQTADRL